MHAATATRNARPSLASVRAAWVEAHAAEVAWLEKKQARMGFAASVLDALHRYGSLTERQLATVQRLMGEDKQREEQFAAKRAQEDRDAQACDVGAIAAAFERAKAAQIKRPRLRLGDFVFSLAPANGANAGAVYVKTRPAKGSGEEGTYLGKVMGGRFLPMPTCSPEQRQQVVQLASDPDTAAKAYGKRFGECSVCGQTLENGVSIDRGIGPICAQKYGFA